MKARSIFFSLTMILVLLTGMVFQVTPARAVTDWVALSATPLNVLNGTVRAIAIIGTDVYVGGDFTDAGGVANADYIAKWNGTSWSALGETPLTASGGVPTTVWAVVASGTDVYVGGVFDNAGGNTKADNIAKWDGATWSALWSSAADGPSVVKSIAISGANVYAGGEFTWIADIATYDRIGKWDGANWSALNATPLNEAVNAIAINGTGDVYVGGKFTAAGGVTGADKIAKWSGGVWSALGATPLNNEVWAVAISGTDVYAGGTFTSAGGVTGADKIAKWSGSAWSALGATPLNSTVYAIVPSGTDMYAGGGFIAAGGVTGANNIAKWSGSAWSAVGATPLNGTVYAIVPSGTDVYAGGAFKDAGGDLNADYIAKLGEVTSTCSNAITVANADDAGTGSLRQAIADVCENGTITFGGDYTIPLASTLTISKSLTIDGTGHSVTVSGENAVRVFSVNTGVTFNLNSITVTKGKIDDEDGGGLYNDGGTLTVTNSAFSNNTASDGGGLCNNAGTVNVTNSTFSGNISPGYGGGLYNDGGTLTVTNSTFSGNISESYGGGLYNDAGTLTVTNSTFSDNSAITAGGGLYSYATPGICAATPAVTITNSTFGDNRSTEGGGIRNTSGVMVISYSTVISNTGGGVYSYNDGDTCTRVGGSIIAGNTGSDVAAHGTAQRFSSLGYNLIGTAGTNVDFTQDFKGTGDQTAVTNPLLGTLGDHGGNTQTIPLLPGSPAIDAGPATCDAAPVSGKDQRGVTRPQGTACDIGAYELALSSTGADLAVTENAVRAIDAITYTIVAKNLGPSAANGAVVSSTFSAEISNVTWTCVFAGGAACGSIGSGNHLTETLTTFPMGGVVTYTVHGRPGMLTTGDNVVTIAPPSGVTDPDPSNNRAEYKNTIYRVLLVLVFYNTGTP